MDTSKLQEDLQHSLHSIASMPIPELLSKYGILQKIAKDCLLMHVRNQVVFEGDDESKAIKALFSDTPLEAPKNLKGNWIDNLPSDHQAKILDRWNLLRQQKWIETNYSSKVNAYFLDNRAQLEQLVYGVIRLSDQGLAQELYLRLMDDDESFFELAKEFSRGIEKHTMGIVGPMRRSEMHHSLAEAIDKLKANEIAPPIRIGSLSVLICLIHREEAVLDEKTKVQLFKEMFEKDLTESVDRSLPSILSSLTSCSGHEEDVLNGLVVLK